MQTKGLQILINQIGETSTHNFLEVAQQELKQGHQELLAYLQGEHWEKAAQKAHKLKATANLYASDVLLSYYEKIIYKQDDIKKDNLFMSRLCQELQAVENVIQDFLEHKR